MAAYEVASALAPYADRLVASSEVEPGTGWDYRSLQLLADDPAATVDELGTAIVDSFIAGNAPDTTLALLDLTQMPAARRGDGGVHVGADRAIGDGGARRRAHPGGQPGLRQESRPDPRHYMTDLGALAATIGIEALDVSDQADAVLRALNDVVVHKGSGAHGASFSGLSIYFPPSADLFSPYYVDFVPNPSGWVDFLDAYYAAGQGIAATDLPAFVNAEPDVTGDATGLTVEGTLDMASVENLSSATISYGIQSDDGSTTYYGDEPATIADDGSGLVSGFYDLTVLHISDGVDTATAYISLSTDDETAPGTGSRFRWPTSRPDGWTATPTRTSC